MTSIRMLLATAAIAAATPAIAQQAAAPAATAATAASGTPAGVTAGATVMDQAGNVVGTIDSVDSSGAVLNTGKVKAKLALASFAATPKGPIIALTKDQVEAQVGQASTQALDQALVVGAVVHGPQGAQIGTVESITGDQVVVATPKAKAQLTKSAFAADSRGLIIGMTQAQLDAAIAAAHGGAASATASTGSAQSTPSATPTPTTGADATTPTTGGTPSTAPAAGTQPNGG